jgi:apolipoprotein N-acyltransferase
MPSDPQRGRPDYHDPLAGFGGAPPAQSALTLRLVLAGFGLLVCTAGAVLAGLAGSPLFCTALAILAAIALVDLVVVARRKAGGEPG